MYVGAACQLSGRQRRTTLHTSSVNILKVSSQFLIAYSSCQRCTSAVALLDLSSHLLLSICYYAIRGYVAPSCILHGIFCFIIHDNPHDAYTSVHTICIDGTACIHRCIIIYLRMHRCYTTDCLLALFIRSSISSTYAHISKYMQA